MFVKVNISCQTNTFNYFYSILSSVQLIRSLFIIPFRWRVKLYEAHRPLSFLSIGVCHDRWYEGFVVYFALGAHMPRRQSIKFLVCELLSQRS